jgi:2-polyprenyl-3-methyl-5-hydroxy-6-metoxy-1,4-benzoquinol methylase
MNNEHTNPQLKFYSKYGISPHHQDIKNFNQHLLRREKLYRSLGMPASLFNNQAVLEIGPGGGYNSLAFFSWGANVDFIEPQSVACRELPALLDQYKVNQTRWNLYPTTIEEFSSQKKYDIVIAEGFIPVIPYKKETLQKISSLVNPGGIVVVTCVDSFSYFFEHLKQIVARKLVDNIEGFDARLTVLCKAFRSHLQSLKFSSRPVEDWVQDTLLNPWSKQNDDILFSISECISSFGPDFDLLGTSPSMFTDYSWYKDISFDSRQSFIEQFDKKRHMLLMVDMKETIRSAEANACLFHALHELQEISENLDVHIRETDIILLGKSLGKISDLCRTIDPRISDAIDESIILLKDNTLNEEKVANAKKFAAAFGRGQQYVSMVKRFTP